MIKLIVSDLDGTLLNRFHVSDKVSHRAVCLAINNGVHFAIATGRHLHKNHRFGLGFYNEAIYKIAMNGAIIYDLHHNIIYKKAIDDTFVKQLLQTFPNVPFELITEKGVYVKRSLKEQLQLTLSKGFKIKSFIKQLFMLFYANDIFYETLPTEDVLFITASVDDESTAEQLQNYFEHNQQIVTNFGPNHKHIELVAHGVGKKEAVEFLAHYLNVDENNVAVFGNDLNDVPMLDRFYYSYVPENAVEQAKLVANFEVDSYVNNGVAKKIIEIVTKNKQI